MMLELFWTFFKIGLFTFGGGYAMIPMLKQEVVAHGWMEAETLLTYIGICESTPGPIAVNMATFVGSSQAGIFGSICATLGVVLPSFLIILLIASLLKSFRENRFVNAALIGIRPVIAGMIAATGFYLLMQCLVGFELGSWDVRAPIIAIVLLGFLLIQHLYKKTFSPVQFIVFAAICGIVAYS